MPFDDDACSRTNSGRTQALGWVSALRGLARGTAVLAAAVSVPLWSGCSTEETPAVEQSPSTGSHDDHDVDDAGPHESPEVAGSKGDAATDTDAGREDHGPEHDDCLNGYLADPRDAELSGEPDEWVASNGDVDLVLPEAVLAWMGERVWEESHDAWHNVRRCRGGGFPFGGGTSEICENEALIPEHQECEDAEDGYQFLVMHRHMLHGLQQAFPEHTELFAGFPEFPLDASDVPEQWRDRWGSGWSSSVRSTATMLEDIENNLNQFPTEGDLGKFIQCGSMGAGPSSIHGALHFKWVVNESPYSLGKQTVNIDNYMFWKLHGWIDQIWERYRLAKGLAPDEPKLEQALVDQCMEMHTLGGVVGPSGPEPSEPLPEEGGVFHEMVRPVLEEHCSSCHSESSPEAGLSLGGRISSADIVRALVNVASRRGGQFKRVVPGEPAQSWLYLKISGGAMGAGCRGSCNNQVMPPTGQVTLSQSELGAVRAWIEDGAAAP